MSTEKIELWKVEETAKFLKRSPSAIRKLVLRGKIPFRRVGGRICFIEREIVEWIQVSPGKSLDDLKAEESQ